MKNAKVMMKIVLRFAFLILHFALTQGTGTSS
jgi:hypothetical protein